MAFDPPVLSEAHSFCSLSVFNELSSTVVVMDYSIDQGPSVVWANAAARDVHGRSLEEMLELDLSWEAQDASWNSNDTIKKKVREANSGSLFAHIFPNQHHGAVSFGKFARSR